MKVLFTADIHIKLGQKNVPVAWAKNRYKLLFEKLAELSDVVDLTVIGGDIFDKIPNMEELEIYFELLDHIYSDCIIYSGNHEAVKKNTTFLSNLKRATNIINDRIEIIDDFYSFRGLDFIPYNKLREPWPDTLKNRILCTHVRGEIPPHVKAEVPLEQFDKWSIVLAGDLHSYDNSQRNILYPGSPITTSFHRNLVDTGVIVLDTDTLEHAWIKLDVPQLLRKSISAGEEMVGSDYHHTIYEVEGDVSQLSNISSELLDKKVIKRAKDVSLFLEPSMTIEAEVEEYLKYILTLDDLTLKKVMTELHNHVGYILTE